MGAFSKLSDSNVKDGARADSEMATSSRAAWLIGGADAITSWITHDNSSVPRKRAGVLSPTLTLISVALPFEQPRAARAATARRLATKLNATPNPRPSRPRHKAQSRDSPYPPSR